MAAKKLILEAGAKKLYETDSNDQLRITFNDNIVTPEGTIKGKIKGKAEMSNTISCQVFEYLESYNVLTHFISKKSDKEMLVKNCALLPLKIIVSNSVNKSLANRFDLTEGALLSAPVIEHYYLNQKLKDPIVNETHLRALNLINEEELHHLNRTIPKVNAVLKSFFERRSIHLSEFHLQVGRYKGYLVVADEITPDTCSLWGMDGEDVLDTELYKINVKNPAQAYKNLYNQIIIGE